MNSFIAVYIFIIGLCIGSLLNVIALRGLRGEDFVFARSKCPKCNTQLKWYMNIPVISFLFLRGKCGFCKAPISIQYPIVELLTGCSFLASFLSFGFDIKTLFICIFLSFFILLALTDILETVIIDYHAYILFAAALVYSFTNLSNIGFVSALLGGIGAFILLELLARTGYLIANYRIFGEGDSLIALALGGIFGFKFFIVVLALSMLIQSLFAIPILMINSAKKRNFRLLTSYIVILIAVCIIIYVNYFANINNDITYIGYIILITTTLLWSLKNILSSIKNKENLSFDEAKDKFTLFPFGPAMIIAGTCGIFYMEQIKIVIKMFLY